MCRTLVDHLGPTARLVEYERDCGCDLKVWMKWVGPDPYSEWSYAPVGVDLMRSLFCEDSESDHLTETLTALLSEDTPQRAPLSRGPSGGVLIESGGDHREPVGRNLGDRQGDLFNGS